MNNTTQWLCNLDTILSSTNKHGNSDQCIPRHCNNKLIIVSTYSVFN